MTFADLPRDWASRPVTDPDICHDLLDLVVYEDLRQRGGLALLLTSPDNRLVQPLHISDVPSAVSAAEARSAFLQPFVPFAEVVPDGGVLLAIARRARLAVTARDLTLASACADVCDELGLRALGVFVVTPGGSLKVAGAPEVADRMDLRRSA